MDSPAIIVVAYNRPYSLQRLLRSLGKAAIQQTKVPLVISIDHGGDDKVVEVAEKFDWPFGEKEIIRHKSHFGLKDHILWCGSLSVQHKSAIILEDDLFVSPYFYDYIKQAIDFYKNNDQIAGIALYSYHIAESCYKSFGTLEDGYNNYFMQVPCSWGQCWTAEQLSGFQNWLVNDGRTKDTLPVYVQSWPASSWKKLFYQYLIDTNKYFVYPTVSLTTNFADRGTHFPESMNIFQVPLLSQQLDFKLCQPTDSKNIYDSYFEMTADCFKKHWSPLEEAASLDLYGLKAPEHIEHKTVITAKDVKNSSRSFGVNMQPLINNVVYANDGDSLHLSDSNAIIHKKKQADLADANTVSNAHKLPFHNMISARNYFKNWYVRIKLILKNWTGGN